MTELRTVWDTNAVISAMLLPFSVSRKAFDAALEQGRSLLSAVVIQEIDEVLRWPRFDKYLSEEDRVEFLTTLILQSELVNVTDSVSICRDPQDNKFLELAISGRATHVITGDADLLVLHPFRGIAIVSPSTSMTLM